MSTPDTSRATPAPTEGLKPSTKERLDTFSIPEPNSGCSLWLGAVTNRGYGKMSVAGCPQLAHRIAYREYNGPIPIGLNVLHRCDTPSCINPDHLFLGTQKDNMADCARKNRHGLGERNSIAVLTEEAVREIRQQVVSGSTDRQIAVKFGVHPRTIRDVRTKETWKHIL